MNTKRKLTAKQLSFITAYCTPGKGYNNATQAAILAGYSQKTAKEQGYDNLTKPHIKRRVARFKADLAAESRFTREQQLTDLENVKTLAVNDGNLTAITGAIREQNEMLGYHREAAPNLEKEQQRKELIESEREELQRVAAVRTEELSRPQLSIGRKLRPSAKVG